MGCAYHGALESGADYGPPPHAPAHGHHHHGHGIAPVFDSGLNLYVVSGRPLYYFQDGWDWRRHRSALQVSLSLGGPWRSYGERFRYPPPGLAKIYGYPYRLPPGRQEKTC